jgi:hypothetical protein
MSNRKQRKKIPGKKDGPGKKALPCSGGYPTHAWADKITGMPINERVLSICCTRCGIEFRKVYELRKGFALKRYYTNQA